jgi:type II secretory ATPase GspE/PulE/Tfp pilus assembly ATPase PilB-like protein
LLRQDPEVIFVGEIRDTETAEAALQAALTGHLLLSSFHAGSAAEAVSRLSEMGIAPYALRSGVLGVLNQRLVRRLCTCALDSSDAADQLGLDIRNTRVAVGCAECRGTGYRGRTLLAELLPVAGSLDRAVLAGADSRALEAEARRTGMITRWDRARQAVEQGITSAAEVRRVLGFSEASLERVE